MKQRWKIVNELMGRNVTGSNRSEFIIDDIFTNDPKLIANSFNDFFANIAPKVLDRIPRVDPTFDGFSHIPNNIHSCFLMPCTRDEISKTNNNFDCVLIFS